MASFSKSRKTNLSTTIYLTTRKPNVQLKRGLQNIIKYRPGPTRVARTVTNSLDSWKLFMTDNIIRIITMHTNERITEFLEENPVDSAKHTHCKLKAVLHGTMCMIRFACLLFGFKMSSYKSEEIELILCFKNRIIQIVMQKVVTIFQFTRSD